MKKWLGMIFLLLFAVLSLTACRSSPSSDTNAESPRDAFLSLVEEHEQGEATTSMEIVEEDPELNITYLRDKVTDVLYLWRKVYYSGGLTVMLDPETGLPLTYARYQELASALST